MKNTSCSLCGSTDTHLCSNDYLCCINILDSSNHIMDWLYNTVVPYTIELKKTVDNLKIQKAMLSIFFIMGIICCLVVVLLNLHIL